MPRPLLTLSTLLVTLNSCIGPAKPNAQPNPIQRAKILDKNELSITIEHSDWGKPIAFRLAREHCESLGKMAVYQSSSRQYGPDVISTWRCQKSEPEK